MAHDAATPYRGSDGFFVGRDCGATTFQHLLSKPIFYLIFNMKLAW
jgi:hypothetical protein